MITKYNSEIKIENNFVTSFAKYDAYRHYEN